MLKLLEIKNYQSLRDVSLKLGWFTVVTGPTGSGKTAVLRALRLLAFNAKGTSYITRGQKTCSVHLEEDSQQRSSITLTRGGRGGDSYAVERSVPVPAGGYGRSGAKYTKLAGKVPEDVTALLHLTDLNFAGQFDGPFLLETTAGEVARVLGRLTNVTVVFEAVREANRRKARLADQLKDREAELERLLSEAQRFASLPRRLEAVRQAEEAVASLSVAEARIVNLRRLVTAYRVAQDVLERTSAAVPEAPSLEAAQVAVGRWELLRSLLAQARNQRESYLRLDSEVAVVTERILSLERQYHTMLKDAGVCPLCGQKVS